MPVTRTTTDPLILILIIILVLRELGQPRWLPSNAATAPRGWDYWNCWNWS